MKSWMVFAVTFLSGENTMLISGPGSVTGASGTQYDFTNMTNGQAAAAAATLSSEGKMTADAAGRLMMTASNGGNDTIPIDPAKQATWTSDSLSSTTRSNYVDIVKGFLAYDSYSHNDKAVATDNALLKDMETYQSTTGPSIANSSTTGKIISTIA